MFSDVLRITTHATIWNFEVISDKINIGWKCSSPIRKEIVDRSGSPNSIVVNVV
jgi:hypothetical protein